MSAAFTVASLAARRCRRGHRRRLWPDSGDFIVPAALAPVSIDRVAADVGVYVEPAVWMFHA